MAAANPSKLGRYEIVDEIGKGAMGIVYLAKDPLIGRLVALKTFRVGYAVKDEELQQFRSRFIREAQSAGILSHPNIVTIHDVVDASDEGVTFIAMEYVRGTNLKELLQSEREITLPFAIDVVCQIADALDYAHSKGVVHRDIKPANVLITSDNRVKITDFGIARLNTSSLTHEGQLLGTPNYMAPEQILGKDVDQRADIFSLGVVLYEMVTRRKPFQGENMTVVTHRIVYDAFTPPDQHAPGLPVAVKSALHRALEKDPNRRYQHAGEMAEDLRRAQPEAPDDGNATQDVTQYVPQPTPPRPRPLATLRGAVSRFLSASPAPTLTADERAARPRQARRVAWAMGALAAVAAAGLGALLLLAPSSSSPPAPAPAPAVAPDAGPALAQAVAALSRGDAGAALAALDEAERLAPGTAQTRALRAQAEALQTQTAAAVDRRRQRDERLAAARTALAGKRWEEARSAAQAALDLEPGNAEATQLRAQATSALEEQQKREQRAALPAPAARPPAAPATKAASARPSPPPAERSSDPSIAEFVLDFYTEASEGVLAIYVGNDQVVRESFHFAKRISMFRSEAAPGRIDARRRIHPGASGVRVILGLEGKPARTLSLDAAFPAGVLHTLHLRVSKDGEPLATID